MRVIFDTDIEVISNKEIKDANDFYIFAVDNFGTITYLDHDDHELRQELYIGGIGVSESPIHNILSDLQTWMKNKKEVHVFEHPDLFRDALIRKIREVGS